MVMKEITIDNYREVSQTPNPLIATYKDGGNITDVYIIAEVDSNYICRSILSRFRIGLKSCEDDNLTEVLNYLLNCSCKDNLKIYEASSQNELIDFITNKIALCRLDCGQWQ